MDLIEKYLGKIVVRERNGKERFILVTKVDHNGKYGYPVIDGILKKQDDGFDTTPIGNKVWCYVEDIVRVEERPDYTSNEL